MGLLYELNRSKCFACTVLVCSGLLADKCPAGAPTSPRDPWGQLLRRARDAVRTAVQRRQRRGQRSGGGGAPVETPHGSGVVLAQDMEVLQDRRRRGR